MWLSIYNELKGWQTAIGSILGFAALMIAALWNFRLNRRRDARLRTEELHSVAAALYGEILLLRQEIAALANLLAKLRIEGGNNEAVDKHFVEAHGLSQPLLYNALAPKIGLLDSGLVIAITEFHRHFQEMKRWLPLLIDNRERGYGYSLLVILRPARDAVQNIKPAVQNIERMIGIKKPAAELDLGPVEDVIEMEEEIFKN